MTEDVRMIRELVDTWMAATKAGDLATMLDLMTDDVLFMVPGRDPFGKTQFREAFESMLGIEMDGRSDVREIEVSGDWAWIRNHIDLTVIPPGRKPMRRSGYTLTILKKDKDRRWRLFRDANFVS